MPHARAALAALMLTVVTRADDTNPFFDMPSVPTDEPADQLTRVDVDGDGFDDLVLVLTDGAPRVALAVDGGGFADELPTNLPAFASTRWHFGDIDGDGDADAVATTSFVTTVPVYRGNGDGTFTQTPSVELDEFRFGAVLGDVDGDGTADLVASYQDTPRLRVVYGSSAAPFSTFVDVAAPLRAEPALVADVDGDGHADLVSVTGVGLRGDTVDVIRGLGDRTFAPPVSKLAGDVFRVVAGDHDGDGDAELAIVNDEVVRVVDATSDDLTLIAELDTLLGEAVWTDVDEDGDDDLIVGNAGGSFSRFSTLASDPGAPEPLVEVFRGNGPAGFRDPTPLDVDRDGHVDVVFGVPFQPWLHVARGRGDGAFDDHLAGCLWFDVGDVDEDGRLDVVTIERVPLDGWRILLHRGAFGRSFEPVEELYASKSLEQDLGLGDVDGDGHLDIAFNDQPDLFDGRVTVLLGDGTGSFALGDRVLLDDPRDLLVRDLNGDGRAELVVGGEGVRIFAWTPGGLVLAWSDADPPWTTIPFVADIDGVEPLDLLITFQNSTFAEVRLGLGHLDFADAITAPLQGVRGVGDVTGDGIVDLLGFLPGGGDFASFTGAGDGTFTFTSTLDLPFQPNNVALGDIDGDGLVDLATFSLARFGVALGVPGGGFAPGVELPQLPVRGSASQLVDIHDDGALALVLGGLTEMFVIPNTRRPWRDVGFATPGTHGFARLEGEGPLLGGRPVGLRATGAVPSAPATLVIGFAASPTLFAGGLLVPTPDVLVTGLATDADGILELSAPWPAGLPADTTLVFQLWCVDPGAPTGFSSTIALEATTP